MNRDDAETIKKRIEECLELVDVRDGFMYLTLRMALLHASKYLEKRDLEKKTT